MNESHIPPVIVNRQPFHFPTFCAEMAKRMPCQHERAEPRLKGIKPNGSKYYRLQCPTCGAPLQPAQLAHRKVEEYKSTGGVVNNWDTNSCEDYYEKRQQHSREIKQKYCWDHEGWWTRYTDYLESPQWRARRALILSRDGLVCRRCKTNEATQVHHKTYERTGNEADEDLESVCAWCHKLIHS